MEIHRSTNRQWLTRVQATAALGVKAQTLYTYASRGWVRTRSVRGREKLYARADVQALVERAAAHAGRGPRAAGALAWGEPVLTTEVGGIDPDGPYYRGVPATDLLDAPFEQICALLWQEAGRLPQVETPRAQSLADLRALVARHTGDAWSLVGTLIAAADPPPKAAPALVLVAEHGLNASTFTARVIASTGADLQSCIVGAISALSGPKHGTASLQLAALLDAPPKRLPDPLPGFGHRLYPDGDPRADALFERIPRVDPRLAALIDRAAEVGLAPNIDAALVALALSLDESRDRIPLWFAAARSAGWVAHIHEQWLTPGLLRPRAAFAGWTS